MIAVSPLLALMGLIGTVGLPPASAHDPPRDNMRLVAESAEVRLSGDSNLWRWSCSASALQAFLEIDLDDETWHETVRAILEDRPHPPHLPQPVIRARFAIAALECGSARMERDLRDATRAADHPEVIYALTHVDQTWRGPEEENGTAVYGAETVGSLTLAGRTRPTQHDAYVRIHDDGNTFEVEGVLALNMKDFGIEPPVALLGLLRAREDIQVWYRLVAHGPDEPAPSTSLPE